MTRKDSEKDADRPHYYSQFWLDVAAGRRVIGAPRTDEGDTDEGLEPVAPRRPVRSTSADSDGYHETVVHPQVEPELEEDADEYSTPDLELDTADDLEEEEIPAFGANEEDIPDVDIMPQPVEEDEEIEEPENEEEDFYDEEEEDEEEDDTWSARGRKKPKPGRQTKLPSKPSKRSKREPRRGF